MPGPLRRCQHCHAEIPAASYRCSACGTRLDAKPTRRPTPVVTALAVALFAALILILVAARTMA